MYILRTILISIWADDVAQVFMDSSLPVIQYYEARGKVRRIDANRPVDQVYADVKILFEVLEAKAAVPAP